jgi:hypothetical protein
MNSAALTPGIEYTCQDPLYGVNYDAGYTGFTCTVDRSAISKGIAWFSRWDQLGDISVTHALTVTGPNTCVEALIDQGVVVTELDRYFNDPNVLIFFRKPIQYDSYMARNIVEAVCSQVGTQYDDGLIKAHAIRNTYLGRLLALTTKQLSDGWITAMLENPAEWICSELAAYGLNGDPRLAGLGVLRYPPTMILPQTLFEDEEIYDPWHQPHNQRSIAS